MALRCLFKKAVGSPVCTSGAWCLATPTMVVIWLSHGRLQKSFEKVRLPPKEILWSPACKERSWEGAWAFIIHYADFHQIPLCSPNPWSCWAWCSLTQPDSSKQMFCHLPGVAAAEQGESETRSCLLSVASPALLLPSWGTWSLCFRGFLRFCQENQLVSYWSLPLQAGQVQLFHSAKSDTNCPSAFHPRTFRVPLSAALVSSRILPPYGFVPFSLLCCGLVAPGTGAGLDTDMTHLYSYPRG